MAKKRNQKTATPIRPEEYIRKKARQLPVYKCYKSVNNLEDREMAITVIRQHPHGTFTFASFLLDRWCLGVKDVIWQFNVSQNDLDDFVTYFKGRLDTFDEIEYVEAHNWVYGVLSFAEEAGISPCKDFGIARYILEEDDEDVELIEYDFGRNGEYCLVAKNWLEAAKYIPILDKNIGRDNYTVEVGLSGEDFDDDDEFDDIDRRFNSIPEMEYTYQGKNYPKEVILHCPELEALVQRDIDTITDDDIKMVLSLPADNVRSDLQNLILRELGRQWGKNEEELDEDESCSWFTVSNACMFLTKFATVEDTLPVILEIMRQGEEFRNFNFGDISDLLLDPVLCILVKDNPRLLQPYLLEPGLYTYFKLGALELLDIISQRCPQSQQVIKCMAVDLLQIYKHDLPQRTICDGTVTSFTISLLVNMGATEYLPLIEELYATGMIDEALDGPIEVLRETIQNPTAYRELPPMDPYAIRDEYRRFIHRK